MCTGFIKKGNDIVFGYNLDIDPNVWNYGLYKTKDYFTVGIKVGSTLYFTHGVNKEGNFSNLPYMNGDESLNKPTSNKERIDLLTDRYIRNKFSYQDIEEIIKTKSIVNVKNGSMHSLIGDKEGHILLIEPGYGYKQIEGNYGIVTNFPLLTELDDYSNPFYGKDRYDIADEILKNSTDDFSAKDGLRLLQAVKQEGKWGTRISFVYSHNEHTVYYCLDGDFENIEMHRFVL